MFDKTANSCAKFQLSRARTKQNVAREPDTLKWPGYYSHALAASFTLTNIKSDKTEK